MTSQDPAFTLPPKNSPTTLWISCLLDLPVYSVPCSPGHASQAFQVVLLKGGLVTALQELPSNISHYPLFVIPGPFYFFYLALETQDEG